jgi:hypothetical protein
MQSGFFDGSRRNYFFQRLDFLVAYGAASGRPVPFLSGAAGMLIVLAANCELPEPILRNTTGDSQGCEHGA